MAKGRCDWNTNWGLFESEHPSFMVFRSAALMLVYEASQEPPRDAIQTGLEIVALGQDIGRMGTMTGQGVGGAVSHSGFQSLAHSLGRAGLKRSDYERVLDALASYRSPTLQDVVAAQRLWAVASVLEASGRRLDEEVPVHPARYAPESTLRGSPRPALDVFLAMELEAHERFLQKAIRVMEVPPARRAAAQAALDLEIEASPSVLSKGAKAWGGLALRDWSPLEGLLRAIQVLTAAHLVRLEQGSFPTGILELGMYFADAGTIQVFSVN
ncbi:MAG: hypothetical protein JKY65_28490 [Planctomycetes bacterium]|nr:hypothetical protein [Planctomycetota bacterium]